MKLNSSTSQRGKQKLKLNYPAAFALLFILIVGFFFIFNIGNIRHGFSTPITVTYYAVNDGEWDSVGTWSTVSSSGAIANSYPVAGSVVSISGHKIRVSKQDAACAAITITNGGSGIYISNGRALNGSASVTMSATSGSGNLDFSVTGTNSTASFATDFTASMSGGNVQMNIIASNNAIIGIVYNLWLSYSAGTGTVNTTLRNSAQISTGSLNYTSSAANKTFLNMYNTSSFYLRGNIARRDTKMLYGTMMCYDSSLIYLKGSAQQQINVAQGGDTMFMAKLLIRNTNATVPQVTLTGNVNVTNNLSITSGIVQTTSSAMFVLGSNATVTAGSSSYYVSGPMRKDGKSAIIFPIGKNGTFAPLGISAPSTSSTFVAEYFDAAYSTLKNDTGIVGVSNSEYWNLQRTAGTGSAFVTLYWNSTTHSKITSGSDLRVTSFNGTKWVTDGNAMWTGNTSSGSVTSTQLAVFNPITFGSHSGINALPVTLSSFDLKRKGNAVDITWTTSSEINNAYFEIERSQNGTEFETIEKINGHGNSQTIENYSYTDAQPLSGTSYYRLKQTDYNGKFEIFSMKAVSVTGDISAIGNASPNPFFDHFNVDYTLGMESDINIEIVNMSGTVVATEKVHGNAGKNEYHYLNGSNLKPGTYILRIGNGNGMVSERIVKGN